MRLLREVFSKFSHHDPSNSPDTRSNFIIYKIVDSLHEGKEEHYKIQCINTKAIFQARISDIVYDPDILHGFHPVQACYIGIEYAKHLKNNSPLQLTQNYEKKTLNKYSTCRYGNYNLCSQGRKGNIHFTHKTSHKPFCMDPRDIAFSRKLIEEFDAAQAFYIGLLAGIKLNNSEKTNPDERKVIFHCPHLKVVK